MTTVRWNWAEFWEPYPAENDEHLRGMGLGGTVELPDDLAERWRAAYREWVAVTDIVRPLITEQRGD